MGMKYRKGKKNFLIELKFKSFSTVHLDSNEQIKEPEQTHKNTYKNLTFKMIFIKKILFEGNPNEQINN